MGKWWEGEFISSVQSLSCVQFFETPWTAALSINNSWRLVKIISIKSVMPCNHLIFCHPLFLLLSMLPSIRFFPMSQFFLSGGKSTVIATSVSVLPTNIHGLFPLGSTGVTSLQSKGLSSVCFNTIVQKHPFFGAQLVYSPTLTCTHYYWKNHSFG